MCKKRGLANRQFSPQGPRWRALRDSCNGTLERKREYLSGFLSLGPRGHLSLTAIWNFSKEQGSPELIPEYGAQRVRLSLGASGQ